MIGEDEYKTETTLPAFARQELEPRGFHVRIVQADPDNPNHFPGLVDAVREADLVVLSVRRRHTSEGRAGRPARPRRRRQAARRDSHGVPRLQSEEPATADGRLFLLAGARRRGPGGQLRQPSWGRSEGDGRAGCRRERPRGHQGRGPHEARGQRFPVQDGALAASTTPLAVGSIPGKEPEPVAWTNEPRVGHGRVFYTSLGHADDFAEPAFKKLLLNGICWTLGVTAPGE